MIKLIKQLQEVKPVIAGTLEEFYTTGKKAAKDCKSPEPPRKYGPFFRLSFSLKGHNSSISVPREDSEKIREFCKNYREMRENYQLFGVAMLNSYRENGFEGMLREYESAVESVETALAPCESAKNNQWKRTALAKTAKINEMRTRAHDLEISRDNWKEKAVERQKIINDQSVRIAELENQIKVLEKKSLAEVEDSKKKRLRSN